MSSTLPVIEGEAIRRTQPTRPQYNRESECVSQTSESHAEWFTYQCVNRRALVEMQRKVAKRGKRGGVLRFILAKDDKEKIGGWKQDLVRILQVFSVR
jgi:hypothetical protein